MVNPRRGEIWIVDLGPVAKTRPAMVVSIPLLDEDRALVTIVPHTTSTRQTRFEVPRGSRTHPDHRGHLQAIGEVPWRVMKASIAGETAPSRYGGEHGGCAQRRTGGLTRAAYNERIC